MNNNRCDDQQFALQIRRLLISIAALVAKRYGTDVPLIILKGDQFSTLKDERRKSKVPDPPKANVTKVF